MQQRIRYKGQEYILMCVGPGVRWGAITTERNCYDGGIPYALLRPDGLVARNGQVVGMSTTFSSVRS